MGAHREIEVTRIFAAETIAAGAYSDSAIIDLSKYAQGGNASLHFTCTGAGASLTVGYLMSNSYTGSYVLPVGSSTVVSAVDAGTYLYDFSLPFAAFMKIRAVEASGVGAITITYMDLAIQ